MQQVHECNLHIYRDAIINSIFPAPGGDRERGKEREEQPLDSRRTQKQNSKAIGNYDELPAPDGEIMRCSLAVSNGSRRESIKEAAEEGEHNRERRRKECRAEEGGRGAATSDLSGAQSGATKC